MAMNKKDEKDVLQDFGWQGGIEIYMEFLTGKWMV